jgi:hypothetical protein
MLHAVRPELFQFEPLDYNTTRGIDLVARNKSDNRISESEMWYVELKYFLRETLEEANPDQPGHRSFSFFERAGKFTVAGRKTLKRIEGN